MITVVPTGTPLAGHCCVPLEPGSRDGHQWVPLAHTGSYWGPPEAMSTTLHSRLIAPPAHHVNTSQYNA